MAVTFKPRHGPSSPMARARWCAILLAIALSGCTGSSNLDAVSSEQGASAPHLITDARVDLLSNGSLEVRWNASDSVETSWVAYGQGPLLENRSDNRSGAGAFVVFVDGLDLVATHYFQVFARATDGAVSRSPLLSYAGTYEGTSAAGHQEPVRIVHVDVESLHARQAIVAWEVGGNATNSTWLEYRAASENASVIPTSGIQDSAGGYYAVLEDLAPSQTYNATVFVTDGEGTVRNASLDFTTPALEPDVWDFSVMNRTFTRLTVAWSSDGPNGTTVHFEYGDSASTMTNRTLAVAAAADGVTHLEGLAPNRTYWLRAVAEHADHDPFESIVMNATTPRAPAMASNVRVTHVSQYEALINATIVGPNGTATELLYYQAGHAPQRTARSSELGNVSWNLSGLQPDSLYHFRIIVYLEEKQLYADEFHSFTTGA